MDRATPARERRDVLKALLELGPRAHEAVPALATALKDEDMGMRTYATFALEAIGEPARSIVSGVAATLVDRRGDLTFRIEAARALGKIGGPAGVAVPALLAGLEDPSQWLRIYCARALGAISESDERIVPALARAMSDADHNVRRAAVFALSGLAASTVVAVSALVSALSDREVAGLAAETLARLGEAALPSVRGALHGEDPGAARMAGYALHKMTTPSARVDLETWERETGHGRHQPSHADFYIPYPEITLRSEQEAEFEVMYSAAAGAGCVIDYRSRFPKAAFLHYLQLRHGVMFHSSNDTTIEVLEPRWAMGDGEGEEYEGVYGMPFGVWDMFFAIVDRAKTYGISNGMFSPKDAEGGRKDFLYLSVHAESLRKGHWTNGMVYVLPKDAFERTSTGWISWSAVRPLARLPVSPSDFPLLGEVTGFELEDAVIDLNGFPYLDEARRHIVRPRRQR